jgi:hypothetical protein
MTFGRDAEADFEKLEKRWLKMDKVLKKGIFENAVAEREARVTWSRHLQEDGGEYKGKIPTIKEPIQEEYEKVPYMRMI